MNSLENTVGKLIDQQDGNIFLREDFDGVGSYRQVSRILNKYIERGELAKIGRGIYAKTYRFEAVDMPILVGGFDAIAKEALDRLGVEWEQSSFERAYNAGETQQVPVHSMVRLKSRLRRRIAYYKCQLLYEGLKNAR